MRKRRHSYTDSVLRNPITRSIIKSQVETTLATLKTAAEMQALIGDAAQKLVLDSGMLLFAVANACETCRIDETEPDVRILRGMAGSLELLARFPATLEDHRPTIQSGLNAIERLIPRLDIFAIGNGFLTCDERVKAEGFGADDINSMLRRAA
jgi:hypothetical protein